MKTFVTHKRSSWYAFKKCKAYKIQNDNLLFFYVFTYQSQSLHSPHQEYSSALESKHSSDWTLGGRLDLNVGWILGLNLRVSLQEKLPPFFQMARTVLLTYPVKTLICFLSKVNIQQFLWPPSVFKGTWEGIWQADFQTPIHRESVK